MKRLLDIVFSLFALIMLALPMLVLAVLVMIILGSPVLFRPIRPGKDAIPFEMYKFRTMTDKQGKDGQLLPDADRLTGFGRFLRATSLDELPGLWNVLKGDMSLVGPRPLAMQYLPLYSPQQARRHEVRPGITGLAQVSGRNAISWQKKFELDVWYVDNQSMFLDLKILLMTLRKVVSRSDVLADGQGEVESFDGTN